MDNSKTFWDKQTSSLHRSATEEFYKRKAEEHAGLIPADERKLGCIDLGCGAGELIFFFSDLVQVDVGLDYSKSMLDEAAQRLAGKPIQLVEGNLFDYLPSSNHALWTTTGAINQYLTADEMRTFLDVFANNETSRALYLFDCVDPIRMLLMPYGISYRRAPPRDIARKIYHFARRVAIAAGLAIGAMDTPMRKLKGAGMGYGYLPRFWLEEATVRSLQVEIVSSQAYEYRYHVILRKANAAHD